MGTISRLALATALAVGICSVFAATSVAQTLGVDFTGDYSVTDLGSAPGVPGLYGGVMFKPGDNNTLLLGGSANNVSGGIFEIGLTRAMDGTITGFSGPATLFAVAPFIDGGLDVGPDGVLFATAFPNNTLLQYLPGSAVPDKTIDLTPLGISSSVGTLRFVPAGFDGAGRFKIASFSGDTWYDVVLAPDGVGTFDIVSATLAPVSTGINGPEGIVYVGSANAGFAVDSVLISEFSNNAIGAYEIDANGDPILGTRRDFLTGLVGTEGGVSDPVTGDFLFSTFGGGDRVVLVSGFVASSSSIPVPAALPAGLALMGMLGVRRGRTGRRG